MSDDLSLGIGAATTAQPGNIPTPPDNQVAPVPAPPISTTSNQAVLPKSSPNLSNMSPSQNDGFLDFSDRFPDKNHTPLPPHLRNITAATPPSIQQADNKSLYLLGQLVALEKENQTLLKSLASSAAMSAQIAKRKYRWDIAKFWILIVKYIAILFIMGYGLLISYQMVTQFMNTIAPSLTKINQSVSAVEELNGSMQGFDLTGLIKPKSPNNPEDTKEYTSTTAPDSSFTTPAFIDSFKNIDLSNMDSESLLKKLNITPYKSDPPEIIE